MMWIRYREDKYIEFRNNAYVQDNFVVINNQYINYETEDYAKFILQQIISSYQHKYKYLDLWTFREFYKKIYLDSCNNEDN